MSGTSIRMGYQCRPRSSGTIGRRRPSLLGSPSGTLTGSSVNWGSLTKRIGRRSALAVPGRHVCARTDLAPNAEIFALPHIDIHGDIWFCELSMHLMRRMHILRPPPSGQRKDLDDWCRKGGANRDSLAWLIQSVSRGQPENPRLILPGVDGREGPSETLYRGLAKTKRFFYRFKEFMTLRSGPHINGEAPVEYLHHSDAYGFLGDIEGFISTYRLTMDKKEGTMVLRPSNATDKEARFFWPHRNFPNIRSPCG